jgi:glycogen phosphorylase
MVQGVDVWLNTPRRPFEASGTSGMKSAANGGLNCSILDGWWDEAYDGDNGWAIGTREELGDPATQDDLEARSLYSVLEDEVIPLFYQRGRDGIPHDWVRRMKHSMRTIGPVFNTMRMVVEYGKKYYFPLHDRYQLLTADDYAKARELTAYKHRLESAWGEVRIQGVGTRMSRQVQVGDHVSVEAEVYLGKLSVDEVQVQLLHGPVTPAGVFVNPQYVTMAPVEVLNEQGRIITYRGDAPCKDTGQNGFAVRVVPHHELLVPREVLSRVIWKR